MTNSDNDNDLTPIEGEYNDREIFDNMRELSLMLKDTLIYPDHLKGDETFLRKLKYLNAALLEWNSAVERQLNHK